MGWPASTCMMEGPTYCIVVLAGIQPGCFDLFGTERIHSVRDLKGKTVASSPQKILAQGTDWRFLNQLKRELKS
jgi:hypothetical protein